MEKNNKKTYWPHMIVGFLLLAFTLSFWTVKSASSIPVQESNNFMLKYQQADLNINEILKSKARFDRDYTIDLMHAKTMVMDVANAKRAKKEKVVALSMGTNHFLYSVRNKKGMLVHDANVTFLLTRPHTRANDLLIENIKQDKDMYVVENIDIRKAGRYTLQLKVTIADTTGYLEIPAYLKPQ